MKGLSILSILFICLFSVSANAQEETYSEKKIGRNTERGFYLGDAKHGSWITESDNGTPIKVETYKEGLKHGVFLTFDIRAGYLTKQEFYQNDTLQGLQVEYYAVNKPKTKYTYRKGLITGKGYIYYENGPVMEESNYMYGLKDGISKWFDENNKQVAQYDYKNGEFNGTNYMYFPNGNVKTEKNYKNNILNGEFKELYPTGKLKTLGTYVNGLKHGDWIEYDTRGQETGKKTFENGEEK